MIFIIIPFLILSLLFLHSKDTVALISASSLSSVRKLARSL